MHYNYMYIYIYIDVYNVYIYMFWHASPSTKPACRLLRLLMPNGSAKWT